MSLGCPGDVPAAPSAAPLRPARPAAASCHPSCSPIQPAALPASLAHAWLVAAPVLLALGCRLTMPAGAERPAYEKAGNAELVQIIADQPYVTAEAAYRAIYILWKGEPFGLAGHESAPGVTGGSASGPEVRPQGPPAATAPADGTARASRDAGRPEQAQAPPSGDEAGQQPNGFEALRQELIRGGIVSRGWDHAPDELMDRATIGYMVARAIGLNSGVNWPLTGLGRYAWRELQYRGIAGPGGELGLVSGGELLGILIHAEDYLARQRGALTRIELGSEP